MIKKAKKFFLLFLTMALTGSMLLTPVYASDSELIVNVDKAKQKYEQALKEYEQAPIKFLDDLMPDNWKIEDQKKALSDSKDEKVRTGYEKTKEGMNKELFSFEKLKKQADWLNSLNNRRAKDNNFSTEEKAHAPLKLCPTLILTAMMSSAITSGCGFSNGHVLWEAGGMPNKGYGECLCFTNIRDNPIELWYDSEKPDYDAGYGNHEGKVEYIKPNSEDQVGHYKLCMSTGTGVGFGQHKNTYAARFGYADVEFSSEKKVYTADEWLKEVNAFEKPYLDKVNQAKKEWEEAKYTPAVTVTPADLTYNKESQNLVSESKTSGGKLLYCMDKKEYVYNQDTGKGEWKTHKTDWSEKIPTATDAGEYKIYYKVEGTDYYRDKAEQELTVTIKKAAPVVNVEFKNPEDLVVDYDAQGKDIKLVTKAETTGGTLMFSSSKDDKWSNALPTESKPGKYTISYRVDGDKNYSDVPAKTHEVEIKKCQPRVSVSFKKGLVYNGNNQNLVEKAKGNGNSIYYKVDDREWTSEATAMDAGEHKVRYKTEELPYVLPMESEEYTVSIEKAEPKCDAEFADDTIVYDNKVYLVHKTGNDKSPALMAGINYEQKIEYKVNDGEWTTECPKATKAGDYTVSYRVPSSKNFKEIPEKTKTIHVTAAAPTFDIKFAEDQEYNGKAITIFNLLVCENGTFKYKINDGEWSSSSYKKVQKPGTYKITYKVEGNEGYSDIPEREHTVVIREKAKPKANISESYSEEETCTYSPGGVILFSGKSSSYGCKIVYSVNGEEWTETIPEAKNAGTYEVRCKALGNDEYSDSDIITKTFTVQPLKITTASIGLKDGNYRFDQTNKGEEITPVLNITLDDEPLKEGTDYTLEGDTTTTEPGNHTITVKGKGNFTGEKVVTYTVYAPKEESTDKPSGGETEKPKPNPGETPDPGTGGGSTENPKPEEKKDPVVTATLAENLEYNRKDQQLCKKAETTGGTLTIGLKDENYMYSPDELDKVTGYNPGTYTIVYEVQGNSEYNSKSGTLGTVEIEKCDISTDGALEPIYDKELSLLSATQTVQLRIEGIRCFKTSTRLNEGEDYVLEGDTGEISKPGTYSFTVRGTGSKYTGEAKFSFNVVKKYTDPSEGGGNTEKPEPSKPEPSEPSEPPKPETKTQIADVYLSASKYTYNGKVHTPRVEVYGEDDDEVPTDQYKVTYSSGRKNLGSYTVTVTGINDYEGTIKKTYVITPAKMKTPSVKAGKKKLTVKWKKLGGGSQTYQIYVLKKGTKKAKYYTSTGSSKTIKKLSKKKYYYTKIRSYKKISGKTYYGSWSGTKKVKVK